MLDNVMNYYIGSNYQFHAALITQGNIGWSHIFAGRISQEWLSHFETDADTRTRTSKIKESYLWGASIVEVILTQFIHLWELRNTEVHGKTADQRETTRKRKVVEEMRKLNALKDEARPADAFMFHEDVEKFIECSSAKRIATWIKSHRKAIKNSVHKWKESSVRGTRRIIDWMRGSNTNETITRLFRKRRKRILDGRQKERRRCESNESQPSVASYFPLLNRDR